MSWLSAAWDRNRNSIGNAVKNISPALAFVPGAGILGAGLAGAAGRAMQKGTNLGDILKSGVSNASVGAGARGIVGGVQKLGAGVRGDENILERVRALGSPKFDGAAYGGTGGFTPSSSAVAASTPRLNMGSAAGDFARGVGESARGLGSFAKDNATVIGQVGSGVMNARENDQTNDLNQQKFSFEQQQYDDEQKRRKAMADLLGPLFQQINSQPRTIAPNPYTGR